MNDYYRTNRRQLLQIGAASLGLVATGLKPALADVIAEATKTAKGPIISGLGKAGPYRIGFSNGFSGNSWRAMCLAQLKIEAAKHKDISDFIVVDGQNDITKQVNDIESLANQEVDAILTIANSATAVVPALMQAKRAGIVIAPFNLPIKGDQYDAYTGTDPALKGASSGKWLSDRLGGKGKIVGLGGIPGNSYTAAGWAGAQRAFADGIEVLAFRDTDWSEDKAKVVMSDLIAAYPEIDGIWTDGGQVAAGASKALLAADRLLVPVTGDDYNGLLKLYDSEHEKQPNFDIGVISEPTWEGVVALRMVLNLLKGGKQHRDLIITPQLITKDNYKHFIRPNLPDGVYCDTDLSDAELRKIFGA